MQQALVRQTILDTTSGNGAWEGNGAMIRGRRQGWDALMCSRIGFDP